MQAFWNGELSFSEGIVVYRGLSADNSQHAHATLQITVSGTDPITLQDELGAHHSGQAIYVRPGVKHALFAKSEITLILIEPQSALAAASLSEFPAADIGLLSEPLRSIITDDKSPSAIMSELKRFALPHDAPLDERLAAAMELLKEVPLKNAIQRVATHCGLSESRLRAIAQKQLGIPLSKWLLWCAIARAGQATADGKSLVQAAMIGGFSDQAHYTRTVRKLLGVTPGQTRHLF
ncbi:helix-turn-helix transcriptional regulator [Arenicella xantha]|uniref:AraC family transcriptional regulator n=1 Tax=Arenicella xantha TaxID=644221 RepID=A0A395JMF4_9GAMM|nr:helix-turn-helix domain-containing protein [Arenicella xantha]RBP52729.1 AraC family transcriptional regulator [Arenicella xantha]